MSKIEQNEQLSVKQSLALLGQIEQYARRTGTSERNLFNFASVDHHLPGRIRKGCVCTHGQRARLVDAMVDKPGGITLDDLARKTNAAEDIARRRGEGEQRRLSHVLNCKRDERERYGRNFGDWTPVERMAV